MDPPRTREASFVTYLQKLAEPPEDRAALAALRRGLGREPGQAAEMYPHVEPFLRPESRRDEQDAYYLVAALFAAHQGSWQADAESRLATNLGASFARLAQANDSGSIERRFVALMNSRREDVPPHLRHAVSLLKAYDIPVDWLTLLVDVRDWDRPNRAVQRAWARAFWGSAEPVDDSAQPAALTADGADDPDDENE